MGRTVLDVSCGTPCRRRRGFAQCGEVLDGCALPGGEQVELQAADDGDLQPHQTGPVAAHPS